MLSTSTLYHYIFSSFYSSHRDPRHLHSFLHDALPIWTPFMAKKKAKKKSPKAPKIKKRRPVKKVASLREIIRTVPKPVSTKRSEEHTSELQSLTNLVCRLLLEKKKTIK